MRSGDLSIRRRRGRRRSRETVRTRGSRLAAGTAIALLAGATSASCGDGILEIATDSDGEIEVRIERALASPPPVEGVHADVASPSGVGFPRQPAAPSDSSSASTARSVPAR